MQEIFRFLNVAYEVRKTSENKFSIYTPKRAMFIENNVVSLVYADYDTIPIKRITLSKEEYNVLINKLEEMVHSS